MAKLTFRDKEKKRYKELKPKLFSPEAQRNGTYRGLPRDFCLDDQCSAENLYFGIRDEAIGYFRDRNIRWHDGKENGRQPSNHLCCSQSCCINFLFPLVQRPDLIKAIFAKYYPDVEAPLPIVEDKPLPDGTHPFMAFEWIGTHDYLGEAIRKKMRRTRGANFTSADFAFRFKENNGHIHLVLGEWKYTEACGRTYKGSGRSGDVRRNNYIDFFKDSKGVFSNNSTKDSLYDSLFYEPFYQLMRLQLLAQVMEASDGKEMGADEVSVLHICPKANNEFRENVAPDYLKGKFPGKDVLEVWKELVPSDKFMSLSVEDLLKTMQGTGIEEREWLDYAMSRYGWD